MAALAGLPDPRTMAGREHGEPITNHRSSWVRRIRGDGQLVFVKTYEYRTWASRLRNLARWTGPLGTSRAAREFDALQWLADHDLPAPLPLAVLEWRRAGFLVRATLVTAAFPGEAASTLLPRLHADRQAELAAGIGAFVGRLHRLGFRDRNLDLRNLIAHEHGGAFVIAKIDSPRHVLRPPGPGDDALARADWARLSPQLAAFGVAEIARRAAAAADQSPDR